MSRVVREAAALLAILAMLPLSICLASPAGGHVVSSAIHFEVSPPSDAIFTYHLVAPRTRMWRPVKTPHPADPQSVETHMLVAGVLRC